MHSAIDSLLDVIIGIIIFAACLGTFITVSNHLLDAPDMGFGHLEDKAQMNSSIEYNQYNRFSCVNFYQMATIPLVNDYDDSFYTYAGVATKSSEREDWTNKFTQQYWFRAKNIYRSEDKESGEVKINLEIDLNERMMPLKAFVNNAIGTDYLYAIGGNYVDDEKVSKSGLYDIFFYSTDAMEEKLKENETGSGGD